MATKSLLKTAEVTIAKSAHNCRANQRHRLTKGDPRLTIKEAGVSPRNYCLECGRKIVANAFTQLNELQSQFDAFS